MGIPLEKSPDKSTKIRDEGDKIFLQKSSDNYRLVLSLYSKSVAYAPPDSEELALAFSQRSSLWLHLQQYELSLVDIYRALSITKSNDLANQLSSRRQECLNHVSFPIKKAQRKSRLFKFLTSEIVPNGAECIIPAWNEKYGRHYVATRDIRPGEIVMSEKTSFASVDMEQMYLVCAHCLAAAWVGIPCDSCIFVIYCSEACKREAWSQYHDVICALFTIDSFSTRLLNYQRNSGSQHSDDEDLSSGELMTLVRMIIILIRKEGLRNLMEEAGKINQKYDQQSLEKLPFDSARADCSDLKFINSLMTSKKTVTLIFVPILMWAFEKSSDYTFLGNYDHAVSTLLKTLSEKLYRIVMLNSFKFSAYDCYCKDSGYTDCITVRGSILAPCSALFNHSCENNVDRIFSPGPTVTFFANQPIKKGDQLFICYGPSASMSKEMRQAALESFTCNCIACINDWPVNYDADRTEVTAAEMNLVATELYRLLGNSGDDFIDVPMNFNKKFFNASTRMVEFIYTNFTGQKACVHASLYQRYIIRYLYHYYGEESVDIHHTNTF